MKNINIAEILENFPKGTKLYSPIFGDVYLDKVRPHLAVVVTIGGIKEEFLYDGRYSIDGECMLFPSKENRDWNTFGISFNDGDIVATKTGTWIGITTGGKSGKFIPTYCVLKPNNTFKAYFDRKETWLFDRLATEEEKQKLFAAIKASGYKWNAETKTLEKLVKPKFKVGDKVRNKKNHNVIFTITSLEEDYYACGVAPVFWFYDQNDYELVPNKFDISTLKPFDKVLIRDGNKQRWGISFFGYHNESSLYKHYCVNNTCWEQCIPYEGNEYLVGTTNDCDDFYKTWE